MKQGQKIGAVAVVGGGIAGIQSALDIANSGFMVYLIEEKPNVGGVMSQLDKTFPTNDCSSCMMGPKLVELASHRNIKILTKTSVEKLEGEPGNFALTVMRHPRFVREDKCTGCGECSKVCPIDLPANFNMGLNSRKAIYRNYPQAIPASFTVDKRGTSPCKAICPAHISVQGYVALTAQGKYQEALKLIKEENPLPAICGRVCHHPCETACMRGELDEPVAIDSIKRFLADLDLSSETRFVPQIKEKRDGRVAIIGSGPAGLSCAYYLAIEGYQVTVFEKLPVLGGMLTVGIPSYRLPKNVIEAEIQVMRDMGVEFKTGVAIGADFTISQLRDQGYNAFFMGIGAQECKALGIPGEELEGVVPGVQYLRDINLGKKVLLGDRVAVIGGGNVAMDTVRTALRNGSRKPFIVYRRSEQEMPANEEEIHECREEGIEIMTLTNPGRIIGENGRVKAVECVRMELGEPDASGRRRPVAVVGSEFIMEVDAVVPAIGQESDWACLTEECACRLTDWGTMRIDPLTLQTHDPDIFAGGDAVTGPRTVIEAIAAGKQAAISIGRYIQGEDLSAGREKEWQAVQEVPTEGRDKMPRARMPVVSPEIRTGNFEEVQLGLTEEQVRAEASRCLSCGVCSECYQCVDACLAKAIEHDEQPREQEINVGAVIFSPGFVPFDPHRKPEYGYGRWPNVVTSLEYERILSAAGPFEGHIQRLSDGKKPNRIAWIQCFGSRDSAIGQDYCSSVCCMYATKQAMITKEHEADIDTTIFYIDIRAQGKGFDRFYERARDETGVRYVRSMISRIVPAPETDRLLIGYSDAQNVLREEEFDMIVLSVGLCANPSTAEVARKLGVDLNAHGFTKTDAMDLVATSQPGVFVCGASQGPKDIPDSVQQGSSASGCATALLSEARGSLIEPPPKYEERDVRGEKPRVGVFVCHCGINIAGTVDVESVVEYAKTLPGVEYAFHPMFACSTDQQKEIKRAIQEHKLNRFVVASCTPRTHEPLFRNTLREAGLNPYLFELANIREHDSWVHQSEHELATEKAKDLVRMSVSRVSLLEPLYDYSYEVVQKALVVGGGLAGLTAALSVAEQGFPAVLVEKTAELGGNARTLFYTEDGAEPVKYVEELIRKVESNKLITVHKEAEVISIKGACGNFSTVLSVGGKEVEVNHGVGIVATGGREYKPTEYLYGQDKRVLTQKEFEKLLVEDPSAVRDLSNVTMIQCVGSREPENSYCSRVCCTSAVKNSVKLKEINPGANVSVLFRDMRTFGFKELAYQEARRRGVRFFRYEEDKKPIVEQNGGGLEVTFQDAQLVRPVTLKSDLLVLSAAIRPSETTAKLAETLRLPIDQDGFFLEAHLKLRPLDFATAGFFLCGLAQGPKFANESIAQARGAVSRATTILSQKEIVAEGVITQVDPALCRACGECEQTCVFGAIKVTQLENGKRQAMVTQALCTGCGACNAACPTGAASLAHFRDRQINAVIQAL